MAADIVDVSTTTVNVIDNLVQIAKNRLGDSAISVSWIIEIAATLVKHVVIETEETAIQTVCDALHKLVSEFKDRLGDSDFAAIDVAIDGVVPTTLKLILTATKESTTSPPVEVVETVAVGCVSRLLRACISKYKSPNAPSVILPVPTPSPALPSLPVPTAVGL